MDESPPQSAPTSILWRRLDTPGHDACWLEEREDGWLLHGTAVYVDGGRNVAMHYEVECAADWQTRRGHAWGRAGDQPIDFRIERDGSNHWSWGSRVERAASGCADLDLGFTPATNIIAIRRLNLAVGASADVPAAWFSLESGTLQRLDQRYERRDTSTYWYEAPAFGYQALLEVTPEGFPSHYPGLWVAEHR